MPKIDAEFWNEVRDSSPKIWKITCVIALIASAIGLLADLNNLPRTYLVPGLLLRLTSIAYFLINLIIAFTHPDFVRKHHQWLMTGVIYVVSIPLSVIGAWAGGISSLYFEGVIEAEFAASTFFTIPRSHLITAIIVSNLIQLGALIIIAHEPIGQDFWNVTSILVIFMILAVVAHHILLTYKVQSFEQRRQLVTTHRKTQNILSSITDSFFALDNDWRFVYFNTQAERNLLRMERSKDDLIGKNIWEAFPWLSVSILRKEFIRAKRENIPVTFVEYYLAVDAHMEVHAYPSPEGISVYMNDISGRKRAEEALHQSLETLEQRVAERTAELRRLAVHLESIREDERTRIAREIHDQISQTLIVFKLELAWLKSRLQNTEGEIGKRMKTMSELLNETIENVRQIASELRPGILDDLGLAAAVEWLAERVQERHGIVCTTVVDPEDLLLDPDRSTTIFRILQESLANIVRHSGASKAEISLHQTEDRIILKVTDNGIGLNPETGKHKKGGLGLVGMRERARLFDGIFEVTTKPGLGTTITVQIPSPLPVPRTEA